MSWLTDFLFGKKETPPPPPDYAGANKTAIETDAATLPFRNAINNASRLGTKYTDPETGKVYDFTGLGEADIDQQKLLQELKNAPDITAALLELQQAFGTKFAEEARNQLRAADPTGFDLREKLGKQLTDGSKSLENLYADQTAPTYEGVQGSGPDLSSLDLSKLPDFQNLQDAGSMERINTGALGGFQKVGDAPTLDRLSQSKLPTMERVNATANLSGVDLSKFSEVQKLDPSAAPQMQTLGAGPAYENLDLSTLPQFQGVNGINLADVGATAAGRSDLEMQIMDELRRAGSGALDPVLATAAQQASRARGAATGNILGDSSALQESLAVQLAQQQRNDQARGNALTLLSSGQSTSDTRNRLSQQQLEADRSSAGFNNNNAQQGLQSRADATNLNNANAARGFQDQAQAAGFNNAAGQQNFQNKAAVAGFNNDANAQGLQNQIAGTGFNNATGQQTYNNTLANAGFNNSAAQQDYSNLADLTAINNSAATQGYSNQISGAGANNAATQQGIANLFAGTAMNNDATQGDFDNRSTVAAANNANAQQGFQNKATGTAFNNDTASAAFSNAMAAINQRNQATQNTFSGQNQVLGNKAGAMQQDLGNVQSFLGLQPIVSQGGQLAGLQQGAAPFMQGNSQSTGINPNAGQLGTAFAGNIFGTQGGIFGSAAAANKNRGFLNAFSQIAGGAGSMASGGLI